MHGVRLNVANLDRAQQFYTGLGMVEDIGTRRANRSDGLTSVLAMNDPAQYPSARSVALRWPSDPHMHVNLVALRLRQPAARMAESVDQLGSTVRNPPGRGISMQRCVAWSTTGPGSASMLLPRCG